MEENNNTQTPNTMQKTSTKGKDLAWDIAIRLRGNEFKDMTIQEIMDFREAMAEFLDLKKEW
jgi:hypothetical protein